MEQQKNNITTALVKVNTDNSSNLLQKEEKDIGRVSLLISIMITVLMVVFYYSLKSNIILIENQINQIYPVKEKVTILDKKVQNLQSKMAKLEQMPVKIRHMIYSNMLEELIQKTTFLSEHSDLDRIKYLKIKNELIQIKNNLSQKK